MAIKSVKEAPESEAPELKAPESEAPEAETAPEVKAVRVQAITHRQRHPVTGVMFYPGQPIEIIDLAAPEHAFVRHQLAARVFEIVKNV